MSEITAAPATETFLRRVLLFDAASCAVLGAAALLAADGLAGPLGASVALLRAVGGVLVVCAVAIGVVAERQPLFRPGVAAVVVLNLVWAGASLALAAGAWTALSTAGVAVDVVQAAAVLALAVTEAAALRRLARTVRTGRSAPSVPRL